MLAGMELRVGGDNDVWVEMATHVCGYSVACGGKWHDVWVKLVRFVAEMAPSATLLVYFPGNAAAVQTLTFPVDQVRHLCGQTGKMRIFAFFPTQRTGGILRKLPSAKKFPALIREF